MYIERITKKYVPRCAPPPASPDVLVTIEVVCVRDIHIVIENVSGIIGNEFFFQKPFFFPSTGRLSDNCKESLVGR